MKLYGDNKTSIHIYTIENAVFHERTKHNKIDYYIVRKKFEKKIIMAKHLSSRRQLADLLTKPLGRIMMDFIYDKLGMHDIYAPS